MPEAKHTTGPWDIRESKEGEGVCIYAGEYGIGKVWDLNGNPKNIANARLIAAAPIMLAALKAVNAVGMINPAGSGRVGDAAKAVKAAIDQAEGRTDA